MNDKKSINNKITNHLTDYNDEQFSIPLKAMQYTNEGWEIKMVAEVEEGNLIFEERVLGERREQFKIIF